MNNELEEMIENYKRDIYKAIAKRLEVIRKSACSDCWKDRGEIDRLIKELKGGD
jgi:hypothetical protein